MNNVVETSSAFPAERRQTLELHQTTNLTSAAIAAKIGVPKKIVCKWLRSDGISPRRSGGHSGDQDRDDTCGVQEEGDTDGVREEIAALLWDLTALRVQLDHVEGRIEALIGPRQQSAA